MSVFENPIVYSMIVRDALVVLPLRWKKELDMNFVRDEERVALTRGPRVTKPVIAQIHPVVEDSLLRPITQEVSPSSHHFTDPGVDELTTRIVEATQAAVGFWATKAGSAQRFGSLGQLAHRIIDAWNPFSQLGDDEEASMLRERFMHDLATHLHEMPFLWELANEKDVKVAVTPTPFDSPDLVRVHMQRRAQVAVPIANGYLIGNGYPVIEQPVKEWYNSVVNLIGKVWLNCILR